MSFGAGAIKVGGAMRHSGNGTEVSMATLWVATTRHCHTNPASGILSSQYLPENQGEGEGVDEWEHGSTKITKQILKAIESLQNTASKQLHIQATRSPW